MAQAKAGDTVHVHYTGRLTDGTVFDTSDGRDPLKFTVGEGQVIPGFDNAILEMTVGDKKTVEIPVDQAYGPTQDDLVMPVPRNQFPPDITPEVGQQLQVGSPSGELMVVTVTDVKEDIVTLDANPPLAGEDLTFDIELVAIG
ncbi:MAG: peptidylprolyl isomerase [Desulfobulbaceae bacterium]|nr:peptidylprolyl isomerase [Desulfobulbaceae bacterium]